MQTGGQECIEAGNAENQVYERIYQGFFRHKKELQPQMEESKVDCSETVYLISGLNVESCGLQADMVCVACQKTYPRASLQTKEDSESLPP